MAANLLLVLALGMNNDFWNEVAENIFEKLRRKNHLGPIVTLLHNIKDVA